MNVPRHSGAAKHFVVSLGSLDEPDQTVHAQYRPRELEISQTVPWAKHPTTAGALRLEFSGAEGRSTSLELFLDESELPDGTVAAKIATLTALATVRGQDAGETGGTSGAGGIDDRRRRPHHCVLVFGDVHGKRPFRCVIESINTKYLMFSPEGVPLRAIVTLKLKESSFVDKEVASWQEGRASRDERAREREIELETARERAMERERERLRGGM